MKKILIILILSLLFFSCEKYEAKKTVDLFLKNMTSGKILKEFPYAENQSKAFGEILKKNTYQITNVVLDEKTGYGHIDVKMKIVNLAHFKNEFLFLNIRTTMNTDQSMDDLVYTLKQFFDKKIKENDIYFIERDVKIIISKNKNNNKWEIRNSKEVLDVMLAGFFG